MSLEELVTGFADRTIRALLWSVVRTGVGASFAAAHDGRLTFAVQSLMPVVAIGGGVATAFAGALGGRRLRQRLQRKIGAVVTAMFIVVALGYALHRGV